MRRVLGVVLMLLASCATSTGERLRDEIAAGERLLPQLAEDDPRRPELQFQLASLRMERAEALQGADAGDAATQQLETAADELRRLLKSAPTYARRGEVAFWYAEALSLLGRWSQAVTAWRAVPQQKLTENNQRYAQHRLQQALKEARCGAPDSDCAP